MFECYEDYGIQLVLDACERYEENIEDYVYQNADDETLAKWRWEFLEPGPVRDKKFAGEIARLVTDCIDRYEYIEYFAGVYANKDNRKKVIELMNNNWEFVQLSNDACCGMELEELSDVDNFDLHYYHFIALSRAANDIKDYVITNWIETNYEEYCGKENG